MQSTNSKYGNTILGYTSCHITYNKVIIIIIIIIIRQGCIILICFLDVFKKCCLNKKN